jgi:hypothetical protein
MLLDPEGNGSQHQLRGLSGQYIPEPLLPYLGVAGLAE